jgi:signal transduction histidine kinase
VRINTYSASHTTQRIDHVQRTALYAQIVGAILTVLAAAGIAIWLNRILRRKRELVVREFDSLAERNRDLNQFVGRTAHDLRGPLTPISGYADLLAAGSADVAKAAARIKSSSVQMAAIIEDLLVLSTAGHLPPGEVACEPVISEVLSDLTADLADAKTDVRVADSRVAVPASVLRQLLYNIVSNSIKYRASERRLELGIEVRRMPDDRVQIAITDNGIGIAPEALARVFEPHYRAPGAGERPGSGLGLAIVQRMVSAAGGRCEVTSELGGGTRFVMLLPAAS